MRVIGLTLLFLALTTMVATAEPARVTDRAAFEKIVLGRDLTTLGVHLNVKPDGTITGTAFDRSVTGQWTWQDGFFCRDLHIGTDDLGPNCQLVTAEGTHIQFTADKGTGQTAKLRLR